MSAQLYTLMAQNDSHAKWQFSPISMASKNPRFWRNCEQPLVGLVMFYCYVSLFTHWARIREEKGILLDTALTSLYVGPN